MLRLQLPLSERYRDATPNELADRIAAYPQSGRDGIARVWRKLRGDIADPDGWFKSLTQP